MLLFCTTKNKWKSSILYNQEQMEQWYYIQPETKKVIILDNQEQMEQFYYITGNKWNSDTIYNYRLKRLLF